MDFFVKGAIEKETSRVHDQFEVGQANIKVIGIGGAGNNMVSWLFNWSFAFFR